MPFWFVCLFARKVALNNQCLYFILTILSSRIKNSSFTTQDSDDSKELKVNVFVWSIDKELTTHRILMSYGAVRRSISLTDPTS